MTDQCISIQKRAMRFFVRLCLRNGSRRQNKFHDFKVLHMPEMLGVETHIVESHEAPGGIGQVGAVPGGNLGQK